MSETTYQQFEKPAERERLLEAIVGLRLEEIGEALGNAHVEGLRLEWVSVSSVRVKTGAADVPDGSRRIRVTADITVAGLALGVSVWGHVYLYDNAGTPAVEVNTTAPVKYFGSAYQKTGDATRRYLGSVRTDAAGNILCFNHNVGSNFIRYMANIIASPLRVLNGGVATTETSVDCSGAVPFTSRLMLGRITSTSTNADAYIGCSDDNITLSTTAFLAVGVRGSLPEVHAVPLNTSQACTYLTNAAPNGAVYIDVTGYWFER
jgi:hypothetical protein